MAVQRKTKIRLLLLFLIGATVMIVSGVATSAARSTMAQQRENISRENLERIGQAILEYHEDYGKFPDTFNQDAEGNALLSWRVHLLPYLGQQELYDQFKLDEPWDSEHNRELRDEMPGVYYNPSVREKHASDHKPSVSVTNYLLPVGEGTLFSGGEGKSDEEIIDEPAAIIMVVEANADQAATWTRPGDLDYDPGRPWRGLGKIRIAEGRRSKEPIKGEGCFMLMADGRVHFVSEAFVHWVELESMFTFNGKENITTCEEIFINRLEREGAEIRETGELLEDVEEDSGC